MLQQLNSEQKWALRHRRVIMPIKVFAMLGAAVSVLAFREASWFLAAWSGTACGAAFGATVGFAWSVSDKGRRGRYREKGNVSFGLTAACLPYFSAVGMLFVVGCEGIQDLASQVQGVRALRSLEKSEILSVSIVSSDRLGQMHRTWKIDDVDRLSHCKMLLGRAVLFYPSGEGSVYKCDIVIRFSDGAPIQYDGSMPERHLSDISIQLRGIASSYCVLIPDMRDWLETL